MGSESRRVVITGLGAVSPLGIGVEETWKGMIEGRSGIGPVMAFDASKFSSRIAGEVKDWDAAQLLGGRVARRLDRFTQFAVVAAREAIEDAGIELEKQDVFGAEKNVPKDIDQTRIATVIGSGIGGLGTIEEQYRRFSAKGPSRISPFIVPKMMGNAASAQVSMMYSFRGPSYALVSACAAGAHAIGDALGLVHRDICDVAVAGGSEAAITFLGLGGFSSLNALSTRNDDPEHASRPFDKDRDGFVLAEGAGIVILEELEHARKRGTKIYCELLGYGASSDGFHVTEPRRDGAGGAQAMTMAIEDAGVRPEQIDYINAHGTSTQYNDRVETLAVKLSLGEDNARKVAVSSTKSVTGHLLGAAAGVELIATALAIKNNVIPPTMNYRTPDPDCDLDYVPNEARHTAVKYAMSNSLGFGGHNASLVLGETE